MAIYGKVVQIAFTCTCLYKKSDTGYTLLFTDERIPMPARGNFIYQQTDAGQFAVTEGRVMVGGAVEAGKSAFVSVVYIAA